MRVPNGTPRAVAIVKPELTVAMARPRCSGADTATATAFAVGIKRPAASAIRTRAATRWAEASDGGAEFKRKTGREIGQSKADESEQEKGLAIEIAEEHRQNRRADRV